MKIVKKVLSEGKLTEDFSQRRGNFRIYLRKEIKRAKKITVKSLKLVYTKIKKGIEEYEPKNNRSQLIKSDSNTILLDAYNANPMSIESALMNINQLDHPNKVVILGDMFELGEETDNEHIRSINMCIGLGLKNVYLVGDCFHRNNNSIFKSFVHLDDLIKKLTEDSISNSFILIKGSRGMKLEKLIEFL